jgi:hypothetical protein
MIEDINKCSDIGRWSVMGHSTLIAHVNLRVSTLFLKSHVQQLQIDITNCQKPSVFANLYTKFSIPDFTICLMFVGSWKLMKQSSKKITLFHQFPAAKTQFASFIFYNSTCTNSLKMTLIHRTIFPWHFVAVANDLWHSCKMILQASTLLWCENAQTTIVGSCSFLTIFFLESNVVRKYRPIMALIPY